MTPIFKIITFVFCTIGVTAEDFFGNGWRRIVGKILSMCCANNSSFNLPHL